jgi:hypothetical protein
VISGGAIFVACGFDELQKQRQRRTRRTGRNDAKVAEENLQRQKPKQVPFGNDNQKNNSNGKSNSKSNGLNANRARLAGALP